MADRQTRALSDVLGYVVVFSLVVTSVFLVTAGGLATLEDARDSEQAQNAERAFDVVADNFASIYERNAPSRSTEIDLGESEMFYDSNVSIAVSGGGTTLVSRQLRPVQMNVVGDRSLVYEGGAVFRRSEGGGVTMVEEPPFLLAPDRVYMPVVQTYSPTVESAGSTTILLRGVSTGRLVAAAGTDDDFGFSELTIEVASPRYEVWERYLSERDHITCDTDSAVSTVECTVSLDSEFTAQFVVYQIEMSLIV